MNVFGQTVYMVILELNKFLYKKAFSDYVPACKKQCLSAPQRRKTELPQKENVTMKPFSPIMLRATAKADL